MGDWLGLSFFIGLDLLFLILSVFLLMGKGGWLIAGYNTASEEEKRKYDEKKLCRSMGATMLVITIGMSALSLVTYLVEFQKLWPEEFLENTAWLFAGLALATVAFELVYGNTRCKRKNLEND